MLHLTENNRKWWILFAMAMSLSLVFVDQTAISVALPQMQRDLNMSDVGLQWIINAYLLTLATLVIFGGRIGDMIGHRRTFLVGIVVFILASISCALANSGTWGIISRAIQGIGGAFMIPSTGALVINAFNDAERGKAMGIYVSIASIFLSLGPLLGGLLTQYLSWRWVFWINAPIALVSIGLTLKAVVKEDRKKSITIDWLGFILLASSLCSLTIALMEGVNFGWTSPLILNLFALSILAGILFIFAEMRVKNPLVEMQIFKNRTFASATFILVLVQFSFISLVFWIIFLQDVLQYSAGMAGFLMLPVTLPLTFMAPTAGYIRDRYGPRLPMSLGTTLVVCSMVWVGATCWLHDYSWMFPGFLLLGFAAPLVFSSGMAAALSSVAITQRGVVAGILNAGRQLGSSLGLAIVGLIISNSNRLQLSDFLSKSTGTLANLQESQIDGVLAGTASTKQIVAQLSIHDATLLHYAAVDAYTFAFSISMFVVAAFAVFGILLAQRLPGKLSRP